jgi:hypothetical protein
VTQILLAHAPALVGLAVFFAFTLWMLARILDRAGYAAAWGLVMWLPVINLIAVWVFAFLDWPRLRRPRREAADG